MVPAADVRVVAGPSMGHGTGAVTSAVQPTEADSVTMAVRMDRLMGWFGSRVGKADALSSNAAIVYDIRAR
jgi:hypothetical protein